MADSRTTAPRGRTTIDPATINPARGGCPSVLVMLSSIRGVAMSRLGVVPFVWSPLRWMVLRESGSIHRLCVAVQGMAEWELVVVVNPY